MLNKVMLIGRLGKDPEMRYTQSGQAVCGFSMATDESYTDRDGNKVDRTEWHRVSVWGKPADACSKYLHKGSLTFIEGKLAIRKWQDQQGQDRSITEIQAMRVQFLERKENTQGQPQTHQSSSSNPAFPSEPSSMDDVPF